MGWILLVVIVAVVAVIGFWISAAYNKLVTSRNRVDVTWGQVEVQLQRRADVIPNLVSTVKGYATHESETLTQVIEARQQVQVAPDQTAQVSAENFLTQALRQIFALSEAYPDLKADQNFLQMQRDLVVIEEQVAVSRQLYNDSVYGYNTEVQTFPTNIIAGAFNFDLREMFDAPPSADAAPVVEF